MPAHAAPAGPDFADLLTLSRLVMSGALWATPPRPRVRLAIVAAAAVTDVLDGWAARHLANGRERMGLPPAPRVGVWLDPLCDKAFVMSLLAAIWATERLPLRLLALVSARELVLLPAFVAREMIPALRRRPYEVKAARIGKLTTAAQLAAASAFILRLRSAPALAGLAGLLGVIAGGYYLLRRAPA